MTPTIDHPETKETDIRGHQMSVTGGSTLLPTTILAFERRHPGNNPDKHERIRVELGITPVRYAVLLMRAAVSAEGIAAEPVTARIVREKAERGARERERRLAA